MQKVYFHFDYKKATQALNHLALKANGQINKMKALKLIYFADKYHLRKYGRLITNDVYYAMDRGPVPSGVRNIAEANSSYFSDKEVDYAAQYLSSDDNDRYTLKSIKDVDYDLFSESDMEALDFAWEKFGHFDQFELAEFTHKYPEWGKHRLALLSASRIPMSLEDFFEDPDTDTERCYELDDKDKDIGREQLAEMAHLESLWS